MAIRLLGAHVKENNRAEMPTKEQLQDLDCLKKLRSFRDNVQNLEHSDGSKEDMGEGTFRWT